MVVDVVERASDRTTIQPGQDEQARIAEAERFFLCEPTRATATLTGPDGAQLELSASLYEALRLTVRVLARNEAVAIAPVHKLLTTNEAAELLNVSRPYLVQLLQRGDIPFEMVGTHHRVRFGDLMAYKQRRDARRRAALDLLSQLNEEIELAEEGESEEDGAAT